MDYVVLARKLRPTRFEDLIGQETVARALKNAVQTERVAHAYLFTGARGVGKTSTARILTKAINCLQPAGGEPCNQCVNCQEITRDASPDVYEIDAASNRGIDNIRELRGNTGYVPVNGKYKTYIIDEVHMLTMESFNALLKTLEEPPPHVKFILATTNPHKIPETILSRCQRFDFPRVPVRALADYLARVTESEGIRISRDALEAIARNAAGGVRDALTAIDQVASFAGNEASDEQVLRILGLADNREVTTLLEAILDKSLPAALEAFSVIQERGHDLEVLLQGLIREVKDFSLHISLGGRESHNDALQPESLTLFEARKGSVTLDELQQLFYLLLEVEGQIKRSEFGQACFEMGLVKACQVEPLTGVRDLLEQVQALTGSGAGLLHAQGDGGSQNQANPRGASSGADAPAAPPFGTSAAPRTSPFQRPPPPTRSREGESGPPGRGGTSETASPSPLGSAPADEGEEAEPGPVSAITSPEPQPPEAPAPDPQPPGQPPHQPPPVQSPAPESQSTGPQPAEPAGAVADPTPGNEDQASSETPEDVEPEEAGDPLEPLPEALCEDPRWMALADKAGGESSFLAAKLRRMEVAEIRETEILLIPPNESGALSGDELTQLPGAVGEAFGPAFQLRMIDDTKKKARHAHTIAGRNQLEEQARRTVRKEAAVNHENVQSLLRSFPNAKIVDVSLSDPANTAPGESNPSKRRDDV